jgi:hypothetical protein
MKSCLDDISGFFTISMQLNLTVNTATLAKREANFWSNLILPE